MQQFKNNYKLEPLMKRLPKHMKLYAHQIFSNEPQKNQIISLVLLAVIAAAPALGVPRPSSGFPRQLHSHAHAHTQNLKIKQIYF